MSDAGGFNETELAVIRVKRIVMDVLSDLKLGKQEKAVAIVLALCVTYLGAGYTEEMIRDRVGHAGRKAQTLMAMFKQGQN